MSVKTIKAYYNGEYFVPFEKLDWTRGMNATITLDDSENSQNSKIDWEKYVSKVPFISKDAQEFVNELRCDDRF